MHWWKSMEKRNALQFSKCIPINLQPVNFTSLKAVWEIFARLRLHPVKTQAVKTNPERLLLERSQLMKVQFSYSPSGNGSFEKSVFVNVFASM